MAFNRGDIAQLEYLRTQGGKEGQFKVRFSFEWMIIIDKFLIDVLENRLQL